MKGRESGMPDEKDWNKFFDAECVIEKFFGKGDRPGEIVEFGCGYGTFTFAAARRVTGRLHALDIEPRLIERVRERTAREQISNISPEIRDFVSDGAGVAAGSQSHAMIYNLLHIENPEALLQEAYRVLRPGAELSVIHWRSDIPTPRGPSLAIRPTPEQCTEWIEAAGFHAVRRVDLEACCPYHFGIIATR